MGITSKKKLRSSDSYNIFLPYIFLCVLAFLPLFSFFHSGFPITHDGMDHVARIANFYQNLQDGVLVPRWAENLNWGYGHPVLMFLYPFPSYFASFFHVLGFTLIDSVKVVFGISFICSALAMYLWLASSLNRQAGFVGAMLYIYAPYRFVDMEVRGAFGEHVAFIFLPLMMYFLFKLSKNTTITNAIFGGFSLAGLLLSHNAISIMFLPVFAFYGLFLFFHTSDKKKFFLSAFLLIMIGFALSAFFVIPALLEGKYTLRDIVTDKEYGKRFVSFIDFIYGSWSFGGSDFLSKQVGVVQWIFMVLAIPVTVILYKKKDIFWQLSLGTILVFAVSLFMMMSVSGFFWDHIKILQNFQFPWRFLYIIVFITSLCSALVVYSLPKKISLYAVIMICVVAVLSTSGYWGVRGYVYKPDSFFTGIYNGTTDTGESSPIWSVRFMEKRPKAHIEIIDGKGKIEEKQRTTTKHTYTIQANGRIRVRENTLYFPGWSVFVDNQVVQTEFQDPKNRGLMTFYVENGRHLIQILFKDTKIRTLANSVSAAALVIIGFFCIMRVGILWKRFR